MGRPKKVESQISKLVPVRDSAGNIMSYMQADNPMSNITWPDKPTKSRVGDKVFTFETTKGERLTFNLVYIDQKPGEPDIALYLGDSSNRSATAGWGTVGSGYLSTATVSAFLRRLTAAPGCLNALVAALKSKA